MLLEHSLNQIKNEDYQSLLPEIAELIGVSVSMLEHYPKDMQSLLCQSYVNNFPLGKEAAAQAIDNILNLDVGTNLNTESEAIPIDEIKEQEQAYSKDCSCPQNTFYITRKQILENAKIISDNQSQQFQRQQKQNELILKSDDSS